LQAAINATCFFFIGDTTDRVIGYHHWNHLFKNLLQIRTLWYQGFSYRLCCLFLFDYFDLMPGAKLLLKQAEYGRLYVNDLILYVNVTRVGAKLQW
jgi:hypothetical protein